MTRRAYNKKMPMAPMLRDMARCGQITLSHIPIAIHCHACGTAYCSLHRGPYTIYNSNVTHYTRKHFSLQHPHTHGTGYCTVHNHTDTLSSYTGILSPPRPPLLPHLNPSATHHDHGGADQRTRWEYSSVLSRLSTGQCPKRRTRWEYSCGLSRPSIAIQSRVIVSICTT